MKDSRPLEFYSGGRLLFVLFLGGEGKGERGGARDRALNIPVHMPRGCTLRYFPDIPEYTNIPGYTKNPMSFDMGFSVQK